MAKEAIGSNAIFTGTQKGLTITGSKCYAYSGNIIINNTTADLLTFNTGKHILEVNIYWYGRIAHVGGSKIIQQLVTFNGINIFDNTRLTGTGTPWQDFDVMPFIIPPFTLVNVSLANDNVGDIIYGANLTGKVVE